MRDYLEELLEGSGALLEELRRAERGLSALSGGERNREIGAEREEPGVVSPEAEMMMTRSSPVTCLALMFIRELSS